MTTVSLKSRKIDVGRRLAAARLQRALSQGTVARRARIAPSYLSRIETGKVQPTFRTVERIARALRAPLEEIAGPTAPEGSAEGACPVTARGHCLLDLIRPEAEAEKAGEAEVYTPRQIRMIRSFAAWLRRVPPDRLRAMEGLIAELLGGAPTPTPTPKAGPLPSR